MYYFVYSIRVRVDILSTLTKATAAAASRTRSKIKTKCVVVDGRCRFCRVIIVVAVANMEEAWPSSARRHVTKCDPTKTRNQNSEPISGHRYGR